MWFQTDVTDFTVRSDRGCRKTTETKTNHPCSLTTRDYPSLLYGLTILELCLISLT